MPYSWIENAADADTRELHLWPHQSMSPGGFVFFVAATFALISLPLLMVLGSVVLWGLLPFVLVALGGMWLALKRNQRDAQVIEVLTLTPHRARLVRHNPSGEAEEWDCNRYWAAPELHASGGPVPNYVTLRGCGRTVEIGAFLSEDERISLYEELVSALRRE
ncbi:DUF2244 domain-containing protein [Jhaorihella thermophila]|uniref:Uncharacterized membrane protein n=1 Tax=Jhaorihella thermophila TaxID=488547 RepID=A0A1H5TXT5_9RHOB|nr:DUF2244 domain-containing protein [Jhaorihella thermophila]SEF67540.1 Uncharacterized membrane protein [Jhaorihella thermophila]